MPRFKIHHVTKYSYDNPVRDSANQVMLYPIRDQFQDVLKHDLVITGEPVLETYMDYYGNQVGSFMHADPHNELVIDSLIDIFTRPKILPADDKPKEEQWQALQNLKFAVPYIDFLKQERFEAAEEVRELAHREQSRTLTPFEAANKLNEYVYNNFAYIKGVTSVESTLDEVWNLKAGVCQDLTHMLLVMLKMIDIPARYVSGYVCPERSKMRGEGATHAWVEAYFPYYGWLGLDPTNNCIANDLHVRLAVGRSFIDCSPVRGTYKGIANHKLEVGVSVSYEDGYVQEEVATVLTPQPIRTNGDSNSYRRYMEMIQQQQQQQQ